MTDIVARLRKFEGSDDLGNGDFTVIAQAADTIEQLRARIAEAVLAERRECLSLSMRPWRPNEHNNDEFMRGYHAARDDIYAAIRERTDGR